MNPERSYAVRWFQCASFVVLSGVASPAAGDGVRWRHLSNAAGDFPQAGVGRQSAAQVFDIDKDGRDDLVIAGWSKTTSMVWFRHTATGWKRHLIDDRQSHIEAGGAVFDIDRDGDLDILEGGSWAVSQVWWWENPYPEFDPNRPWNRYTVKSGGAEQHHDQIFGDFNGDGDAELVFWNQHAKKLFLAEIPADPKAAESWLLQEIWAWPRAFKYEGFAKADVDLDGKIDLIGGGRWFKHIEGCRFREEVIDPEYGMSRSVAADFVRGDRPEIVLNSGDGVGPLNLYEWRGSRWVKKTLIEKVDHGHTLQVGDFNGDGRPDLYAAEMFTPGPEEACKQYVLYGDERGNFEIQVVSTGIGTHEGKVGDLDGDGDLDILQKDFQHEKRVDIWLNEGIASAGSPFPHPKPGSVFREYLWTNEGGDAGGSLRVGGRLGYGGVPIALPHDFDLTGATKAEIVIEKLLCHDGTRGLAISVNNGDWIEVPEATSIPAPQWDYQHHIYPVVPVELEQLKPGKGNEFRMRVGDEHPWNWPQNLIYGVHFRIYYDPSRKPRPQGRLVAPTPNEALGVRVELQAEASSPNGRILRVDFVGHYEDVNFEGDGVYTQWHYHYVRGRPRHHIGSVTSAPWRLTWDTSWVPDQTRPFRLAARIRDEFGLTYFTQAVDGLTLERDGISVELCKPYDVPKKWVTRSGEKAEKFRITGDLSRASAAQLAWCSWSPGYLHGIFINDQKVFDREGPRYAYYAHRVTLDDLKMFKPGANVLKTGTTPKYDGKMVHGTEVNWPGIMVLIRYRK